MLCGIVALCCLACGIGFQLGRLYEIREDRRGSE